MYFFGVIFTFLFSFQYKCMVVTHFVNHRLLKEFRYVLPLVHVICALIR